MPKFGKAVIDGVERNVVEVPFSVVQEDWAEYEIPSGKLRLRLIVQRIKEVVDENGDSVRLENGDRHISVEWAAHVVVSDEEEDEWMESRTSTSASREMRLLTLSTRAPAGQVSGVSENVTASADWRWSLAATTSRREMIRIVQDARLDDVADRFDYLLSLEEDADADEAPMSSASLRSAIEFLLKERQLARAEIGVGPLGLVGFDLDLSGDGYIVLQFLDSGLVAFAAMGPVPESGERLRLKGTANPDTALCAIRPFMAHGSL